MPTITQYSGKDAYINGIPCVQSWGAACALSATKYSASCVPGATNIPAGIENWTGSAKGIGGFPTMLPDGTDFTFKGIVNATASEGPLADVEGTIRVEQITIDMNKEAGNPIEWNATYGFQGTPTEAVPTAGTADSTIADVLYPVDMDILVDGTSIQTTSCVVRTAQIVLKRASVAFINNGTTFRKVGNLEASCSFSLYSPKQLITVLASNALATIKFQLSTTGFWEFAKMRFLSKSGFTVDRQSNTMVGFSQACEWNAADAGVLGHIKYNTGATGAVDTAFFGT